MEKSQRAFVGVTLTTVLGISFVILVYAALLGSVPGGNVVVGGLSFNVYYSLNNVETPSSWSATLNVDNTTIPWYAKMNTTTGGYAGEVTIEWKLEKTIDGGGTWNKEGSSDNRTFTLNGAAQQIYDTTDGTYTGNRDWRLTATTSATYRVRVTITSTT